MPEIRKYHASLHDPRVLNTIGKLAVRSGRCSSALWDSRVVYYDGYGWDGNGYSFLSFSLSLSIHRSKRINFRNFPSLYFISSFRTSDRVPISHRTNPECRISFSFLFPNFRFLILHSRIQKKKKKSNHERDANLSLPILPQLTTQSIKPSQRKNPSFHQNPFVIPIIRTSNQTQINKINL